MKYKTKIEFLRSGIMTSIQGKQIQNMQHYGVTTSGPMDYFLSTIGNIILDNEEDSLCFEICKFGPIIKIVEGKFVFLISGNINFKITSNEKILIGKSFKSYILNKGDILELNETKDSNYAYLNFKELLNIEKNNKLNSTVISSSIGINNGKKINNFDQFYISYFSKFKNRICNLKIENYYDYKIRVIKGPQMNYFKISDIKKFFYKEFKISKNLNRVGIRLINNPIKPLLSKNISSEGIIKGSIQVPGDGNPIILAAEHPTIGGYPKIATIIIADFFKITQFQEGSTFKFDQVDIYTAEKLFLDFKYKINLIKNNIVYL